MPEVIEIQGDLVRVIQREVIRETNLADIIPFMENRVPVTLPVLPRNPVRAIHWDESNNTDKRLDMLFQLEPQVRTIAWNDIIDDIPCRLALPYTIFHFIAGTSSEAPRGRDWDLSHIRVYFAKEPVTNLDQTVIPALLPNVYSDGNVCWGDAVGRAAQPLPDRIDEIINNFYLSTFADHGVRTYQWAFGRRTYKKWARETAAAARPRDVWQNFVEWEPGNQFAVHHKLRDLFTHVTEPTTPMTLTDAIPEIPVAPTFGRAEEWLRGLRDVDRFRLRQALANIETEDPAAFVAPAPITDEDDD